VPWGFNTGLQVWIQCAYRRSCDRQRWAKLTVDFLCPSAYAQKAPKIRTALQALPAALPIVVWNLPPKRNSPNVMTIRCSCALQLQNSKNSGQLLNYCPLLHSPNSALPIMLPFSLPNVLHCLQRTFKRVFLCRYKYLYLAYTCCKSCLWYWWAGCTSSWAQRVHRWRNTRPTRLPFRSSYLYMLGMKIRDTFCIWLRFLFLWDPTVVRFEVLLLTVVVTVCCDITPSTLVKVY